MATRAIRWIEVKDPPPGEIPQKKKKKPKPVENPGEPKRGRGRPKIPDEIKAARKALRAEGRTTKFLDVTRDD